MLVTDLWFHDMTEKARSVYDTFSVYAMDPVGFCADCLGLHLSPQQCKAAESLARDPRKKVVITSGHGIGKTTLMAALSLWFMLTRYKAIVLATAPTKHQLYDLLWKELTALFSRLPAPLCNQGFVFDKSGDRFWHVDYKEEWYIQCRTARKDKPEGIQGRHNRHLLILVDEGCGVDDKIFETIENALTEDDNFLFVATNPTRTGGYVYKAANSPQDFCYYEMSALDSPFYPRSKAESIARRYGINSDVYRVRVLGRFPGGEPDQMFPLELVMSCVGREVHVTKPIVWALDVARMGDDSTVLAPRHGYKVLPLTSWRKSQTDQTAQRVMRMYNGCTDADRPDRIIVDTAGIGAAVWDILHTKGFPVDQFNAGWGSSDPTRWKFAKAELFEEVRDRMIRGMVSLPEYDSTGDVEDDLVAQFASIKFKIDPNTGVTSIVPKEIMKEQYGLESPDRAEAVIYSWYDAEAIGQYGEENDIDEILHRGKRRETRNAYDYDEFQELRERRTQ